MTAGRDSPGTDQAASGKPGNGEAFHPQLVEGEVRVIGDRWSPRVHEIKAFLARSRVPYRWLDTERDADAGKVAEQAGSNKRPVVLFPDGSVLVDPDVREVAQKLGLETEPDSRLYDLIAVGGGPAGLCASIHGASEGMRTLIVEQEVPGGQISYSPIVENYPGFPEGLSGSEPGAPWSRRTASAWGSWSCVAR